MRYLVFTLAALCYLFSLIWILDLAWTIVTGAAPRKIAAIWALRR